MIAGNYSSGRVGRNLSLLLMLSSKRFKNDKKAKIVNFGREKNAREASHTFIMGYVQPNK